MDLKPNHTNFGVQKHNLEASQLADRLVSFRDANIVNLREAFEGDSFLHLIYERMDVTLAETQFTPSRPRCFRALKHTRGAENSFMVLPTAEVGQLTGMAASRSVSRAILYFEIYC